MKFDKVMGLQKDVQEGVKVFKRAAVRGVIKVENLYLMIQSNKGDYKLPGGGVRKDEKLETTLIREIAEETGYEVSEVHHQIGRVIERKEDEFEMGAVFEMISHYFECSVTGDRHAQKLDAYEAELGFQPVWVSLEDAIAANSNLIKNYSKDLNPWVIRETEVFESLL